MFKEDILYPEINFEKYLREAEMLTKYMREEH